MAYRSYLRSVLNDNFKILTWVLILFIAIMPNFIFMKSANAASNANPTIGGWKVTNTIDFGIGKKITATKIAMINGAEVVKTSTAAVIPKAANVSKFLAKNAALAVGIAAIEYMLDGVDYVMTDGAIVTKPLAIDPNNSNTWEYLYFANNYRHPYKYSVDSYCKQFGSNWGAHPRESQCVPDGNANWNFPVSVIRTKNDRYDPSLVDQPRTIPISDLGAQVVDKAVEDERRGVISPAVVAARTAAGEMIGEASDDRLAPPIVGNPSTPKDIAKELDKAAVLPSNPAAEGTISTPAVVDPVTGEVETPAQTSDIALDFPVFCGWAPTVCEAAETAVNFMTDFEPDAESGEVTIHEDNNIIFDDSQRFNFSSSCPSPEQFSVSFFGATQNLEFSYQPLCNFMSMIKPFVVAGSYVIGAYIVMGLSRGSAD